MLTIGVGTSFCWLLIEAGETIGGSAWMLLLEFFDSLRKLPSYALLGIYLGESFIVPCQCFSRSMACWVDPGFLLLEGGDLALV